jgi:hypothetical protein
MFVRQNPDHRYGVKSDLATGRAHDVSRVVNNDYFKEFLTERIAAEAAKAAQKRRPSVRARNKNMFKFRSGSVMAGRAPGNAVPRGVKDAERAILQKAAFQAAMRSSMQTADRSGKSDSVPGTQRATARASSVMGTLQPTASNALEMDWAAVKRRRNEQALDFMHQLRHETFEKRCDDNQNSVKPYLPMLVSDAKELIDEQFEASKK